ncbi:hypothetical protein CRYUN_Cryun21dG0022600 [Craigia yunnanensis]
MEGKHSKVDVMNCKDIRGIKAKKLEIMAASQLLPDFATIKFWAAVALVLVTLLWVCALQLATVLNDENTVSKSSFYNPLPQESE